MTLCGLRSRWITWSGWSCNACKARARRRTGERPVGAPRLLSVDEVRERAAFDKRHGQVVVILDLTNLVDGADKRVVDGLGQSCLAVEAIDEFLVVAVAEVRHLEGEAATQTGVVSQVDGPHAALTQPLDDAKRA